MYSGFELGSVNAIIYEYYREPVELSIENNPISKPMITITPQFIWKDKRSILLLNLELFGALGSLNGSFGMDGAISGQLKADSFYQSFLQDSDLYIKFGKYPADVPFGFGLRTTTGQGELGLSSDTFKLFYAGIFYSLFNTKNDDGSYSFNNERFNDDNIIINNIGLDIKKINLNIRLPIVSSDKNFFDSFQPSVHLINNINIFNANSFIGLSLKDYEYTIGVREELSISPGHFKTNLLLAHLTPGEDKSYQYTSMNNKDIEFHYGSHFNYLYQTVGNVYGLNSIGIKQEYNIEKLNCWVSYSGHFAVENNLTENRQNTYIGSIFSVGIKGFNIWTDNTLMELYCSYFKPEGFSVIDGEQTRDYGLQIVLKFQHIMF